MDQIQEEAEKAGYEFGHMTIGECIAVAEKCGVSVGEVALREGMRAIGKSREEVAESLREAFKHNLRAAEIGSTTGSSFLLGYVAKDLLDSGDGGAGANDLVDRIVAYTLAAQVGNHCIGLRPCAGTGDSCPYTGFLKAVLETNPEPDLVVRIMALIAKIGGIFRIGKRTTGCNMEGMGAGAAALAAGFVELENGTPAQMDKAITLALSPTLSVPCTPRVLVPGLCATHIGGGVLIARLASRLAMYTSTPSVVPADVMIALAAQCHLASAQHVVPITIQYMEPFFKHDDRVDAYVGPGVKNEERARQDAIIATAREQARELARRANPITSPFGDAVVGGSSQGVGSPTNCARLAHFLAKGAITKVKIELYSELFARRAINVPGILMAAVDGVGTDDADAYAGIMEKIRDSGIAVEIVEIAEPSVQRVTVEATENNGMCDSLNRGGARLVLRDAFPSREQAAALAQQLNIVLVDQ